MGLFNKLPWFRSEFNIKSLAKDNKNCVKFKDISLEQFLSSLSNLKSINSTIKSRVNLVYNYGEHTDFNISFSNIKKNKINSSKVFLSKGISLIKGEKKLKYDEWFSLASVSVNLPSNSVKSIIKYTDWGSKPTLLLNCEGSGFFNLKQLLEKIDEWAAHVYPLVIGIDVFDLFFEVPCIELLSTVLELKYLKFIFYYKGINYLDFLNIIDDKNTACPAGYLPVDTKLEGCVNSMIELRNLLSKYDNVNAAIYHEVLTILNQKNMAASTEALYEIKKYSMNVYDNILKRYIWPTDSYYTMGYCLERGGSYVSFNKNYQQFSTKERYILVTRDTQVMLNGKLLHEISKMSIANFKMPNIQWVDGVPGSGKTHYILTEHNPNKDLVLSVTRVGIKEIRNKVTKTFQNIMKGRIKIDYKTVSSFIINGSDKSYDRIFIDEAVLMHAGYVGYIALKAKAKEIFLLGDSKQIPYIERSKLDAKWFSLSVICEPKFMNPVSRRCPVDVCYALSQYYESFSTTSNKLLSILPVVIDGKFREIHPMTLILTFTQEEKRMLIDEFGGKAVSSMNILTIHEAQGLTSEKVVLVRINTKPLQIYNSLPHVIVALSRHTESFCYITSGEPDLMQTIVNRTYSLQEFHTFSWQQKFQTKLNN